MKQRIIPEDIECVSLGSGCPNNCEYCKEPAEVIFKGIPKFTKNKIKLTDMNILAYESYPNYKLLQELGNTHAYFELVCGIDYRILNPKIATILRNYRFGRFNKYGKWSRYIRFAWDYGLDQQYEIKDAYSMLINAGFKPRQIGIFILVNWKISYADCCRKLDSFKIWGCHVIDCCYDGGYPNNELDYLQKGNYFWRYSEIVWFRAKCRKPNQMINFGGIDPELK